MKAGDAIPAPFLPHVLLPPSLPVSLDKQERKHRVQALLPDAASDFLWIPDLKRENSLISCLLSSQASQLASVIFHFSAQNTPAFAPLVHWTPGRASCEIRGSISA